MKDRIVYVRVPEQYAEQIEKRAAERGDSLSAIVRAAIIEYFERRTPATAVPRRDLDDIVHDWDVTERGRIEAQS